MKYYVIYENPSDYPGKFVLRQFDDQDSASMEDSLVKREPDAVATTLEEARFALPGNVFNIGRYPQDDPTLKEVWI